MHRFGTDKGSRHDHPAAQRTPGNAGDHDLTDGKAGYFLADGGNDADRFKSKIHFQSRNGLAVRRHCLENAQGMENIFEIKPGGCHGYFHLFGAGNTTIDTSQMKVFNLAQGADFQLAVIRDMAGNGGCAAHESKGEPSAIAPGDLIFMIRMRHLAA